MIKKPPENEDGDFTDEGTLRAQMAEDEYKPNADGMLFGPAKPRILVAGVYDTLKKAAGKARGMGGKGR